MCVSRHFQMRHRRNIRGHLAWRRVQKETPCLGERRWVRSRPDHILVTEEERKRVRVASGYPPPTTITPITAPSPSRYGGVVGLKRYVKERETFPVQPPKAEEWSKREEIFHSSRRTLGSGWECGR